MAPRPHLSVPARVGIDLLALTTLLGAAFVFRQQPSPQVGVVRSVSPDTREAASVVAAVGPVERVAVAVPAAVARDPAAEASRGTAASSPGSEADDGKAWLELRFVGLTSQWQAKLHYRVSVAGQFDHGFWEHAVGTDQAPARVAAPVGLEVSWRVSSSVAGASWSCRGVEAPLRAGEHRSVVVDLGGLARQRYRVTAVAAELMPHLSVKAFTAEEGWGHDCNVLVLDGDGGFVWCGVPPDAFAVATVGGPHWLRQRESGGVVELQPTQSLLGVELLGADGAAVPSLRHGDSGPGGLRGRQLVHVFVREDLPERIHLSTGEQIHAFRTDLFPPVDLVALRTTDALSLGRLVVEIDGERIGRVDQRLHLLRRDGTIARVGMGRGAVAFDNLDPGSYDVRWQSAGWPGESVARGVVVAAGQEVRLQATWPRTTAWTGEVLRNPAASHRQPRPERMRFGTWKTRRIGVWSKIAPDGSFAFELPEGQLPAMPAEVAWNYAVFACETVDVDAERHHVVVREPADVTWVQLSAEVSGEQDWCLQLSDDDEVVPYAIVHPGVGPLVPVSRGASLRGVLGVDGTERAWFVVDGSLPEVVVRPAECRDLEVRNERQGAGLYVVPVGPHGQRGVPVALRVAGATRLSVLADTRDLAVFRGRVLGEPMTVLRVGTDPVLTLR